MMLTKTEVEAAFEWSQPKEIETKRGPRLLRKARPTPASIRFWSDNQSQLSAIGVVYGWKYKSTTEKEFCYWQEVPKALVEQREANVEASHATDADIDVPCPQGLSFLPYQRAGVAFILRMWGMIK
jgi:hypothetical protein